LGKEAPELPWSFPRFVAKAVMVASVKQPALAALASGRRALTEQYPISQRAAKQVKNTVKF
jgi:hypothetical protein